MSPTAYDSLVERIVYSPRYADDTWEYRHVALPREMLSLLPRNYFLTSDRSVLRILSDSEWRSIGIQQSPGWVHYEVHGA